MNRVESREVTHKERPKDVAMDQSVLDDHRINIPVHIFPANEAERARSLLS